MRSFAPPIQKWSLCLGSTWKQPCTETLDCISECRDFCKSRMQCLTAVSDFRYCSGKTHNHSIALHYRAPLQKLAPSYLHRRHNSLQTQSLHQLMNDQPQATTSNFGSPPYAFLASMYVTRGSMSCILQMSANHTSVAANFTPKSVTATAFC